jgi:hypothetical protein
MARVTVRVSVRDLTQADLARIDDRFNRLTRSMNRFAGRQTQRNLNGMRDSFRQLDRQLGDLRGRIPDDEFRRLGERAQRLDQILRSSRGLPLSTQQLARFRQGMRDLDNDLRRMTSGDDRSVRVRVDPDTRGFGPRLRRALTAPFRQTTRIFGGMMSDGIGQGIVAGFQSAGPVGIAIFAGILASIVSLIGAAIGGALVFAFGGAFVGLASMFAVQSDEIKRNWKSAVENMKDDLSGVGDPLIPVIHDAIRQLEDMVSDFAPHFKRAMEEAAPHLSDFLGQLEEGIRNFGEVAFDPMMDAFNTLLDSLGPELRIWMEHLGEAFEYLATAVKNNSDEVALAIRFVLEIITGLIYVIGFLVEAWGNLVRQMEGVALGFQYLGTWFDRNWDIGVEMTQTGIDTVTALVTIAWGWVDRNWDRVVKFVAPGISSVTGLVTILWGWVNRNWFRSVRFAVPGLNAAIGAVRTLWGWVNRNWFRTVTLSISMPGLDAAKAALGSLFAHGGVRGMSAAASGGVRSNMTLVGEQGPELVNLAPGSHVKSNPDTRRALGGQGGSGGVSSFIFKSSGRRVDDLLLEILRESIHQRGGDPIAVLGG